MAGELTGKVTQGRGLAVPRMGPHVIRAIERHTGGMRVVPGTLNLELDQGMAAPHHWFIAAGEFGPAWEAETGQSGYYVWKIRIVGEIPALAMQADEENGYPSDVVEVLSSVHLRSALGLEDGDRLRFTVLGRNSHTGTG